MTTLTSKPNLTPQLILFDMDGVLFDTMPTHAKTWAMTAEKYGLKAEQDEFYLYEGQKGVDTINYLYHRTFGKAPSEELTKEIYEYKTSLFSQAVVLEQIPGVKRLIQLLSQAGYEIGVVTGSSQSNTLKRVTKFFGEYITSDHIVTADSVKQGKPHPEPYIKGMSLFNRHPNETIVIENAPLGVRSASASGAYTIAVTTGPIPSSRLYDEGADTVLPDMLAVINWFVTHHNLKV